MNWTINAVNITQSVFIYMLNVALVAIFEEGEFKVVNIITSSLFIMIALGFNRYSGKS